MTFAKEAWPFVLPFALVAAALAYYDRRIPAIAVLLVGFLVLLFFRDPRRGFAGSDRIVHCSLLRPCSMSHS